MMPIPMGGLGSLLITYLRPRWRRVVLLGVAVVQQALAVGTACGSQGAELCTEVNEAHLRRRELQSSLPDMRE